MKSSFAIFTLAAALGSANISFAAEAADTWKAQCAKCHGPDGAAKTSMGARLKIKDYTSAASLAGMTDAQLAEAITNGVKVEGKTVMPGCGAKLTADETTGLVAFIRAMAAP